jgi:flagellar biosynthetic protein FliP
MKTWRGLPVLVLFAGVLFAGVAHCQSVNIDLGAAGTPGATSRIIQLTALVTALSLAPSLLVMVTGFTRIIIVLSLLRSALGLQGSPPNIVLIGLALFLTFNVMQPAFEQSWSDGLQPMSEGRLEDVEGLKRASEPFRQFMQANARPDDLHLFVGLGHLKEPAEGEAAPWRALVPGFLVSEMRRAFEIGFLIYLPFLVIDLVVACILMSLGMMMLPPNAVSLPFKLIFFVLVDGWRLVAGSLVRSFAGS